MVPLLAWRRQRAFSMCACKSSTHDMHKSVFWARCTTARSVSVEKLKCQRERAGARAKDFWRQPEACGQTSSSAAAAAPQRRWFCKWRFFKEEPRRRRFSDWGVSSEFEESEVDVFSRKSMETAGSQQSGFRTPKSWLHWNRTLPEIDTLINSPSSPMVRFLSAHSSDGLSLAFMRENTPKVLFSHTLAHTQTK